MNGGDEIMRRIEGAEILVFPGAKRPISDAEGDAAASKTPKAADLPSDASEETPAADAAAPRAAAAAGAASRELKSSRSGVSPKVAPAAEEGGQESDDVAPPEETPAGDRPRRDRDDDFGDLDERLAFRPMTDLGNAERFKERFANEFRFCEALGWLAWDGKRWNRDQAAAKVMLAEHKTVRAIQREAEALVESGRDYVFEYKGSRDPIPVWLSEKLRAWGRASEGANKLGAISKRAAPMLQISIDALDADPMKLNVNNGTLVFSKAFEGYVELREHDPADLITKLAPVDYVPGVECPKYDQFLARVQPSRESDGKVQMVRFLHQWAGLALTGVTGEQRYTFHYGKGRNGKGVWVSTLAHILGDYAGSIRIESFMDSGKQSSGGQATPDIAKLPGVRLLATSEPKKGAQLDEGLVKLFTGEDVISARHLNKDFFEFRPVAKLTMQGNYRPKISGTDEGIWGRTILCPWPVFIPKEERDLHLATKLRLEASGILNRYLDGLRDWLDFGLTLPNSVQDATDEYRADSDPLGRFLEVCTRPTIKARVQSSEMHALYEAWAKATGEAPWTAKGLSMAMRERGIASKKSVNVYWLDIELTKKVSDFIGQDGRPIKAGEGDRAGPGEEDERIYD